MKIISVWIIFGLIVSLVGCRTPTIDKNSVQIGQGKKIDPKEEWLGHWESENKVFNYYFSSTKTIAVGQVIEWQGITRHEWIYKVLHTDEKENSVLVQPSFGEPDWLEKGKIFKYIFDGMGGVKVENDKGNKLDGSYKCKYIDDRQEP